MSGELRKTERPFTCLLSHPNRCLKEHLAGVERKVRAYFPLKDRELQKLAELVALFHDAGKATECFQAYIRGEEAKCPKEHSLLSALFLLQHLKESSWEPLKAYLAFVAVKRHHTFPGDFFENEGELCRNGKKSVSELLDRIPEGALEELGISRNLLKELKSAFPNEVEGELKPLRSLKRFKRKFKAEIEKLSPLELYWTFLSLYSSLLLADRQDAAGLSPASPFRLNYQKAKTFVDSLPKIREIDRVRQEAKETVLSKEFNPDRRIYSINLPTGYGKTYTGFLFALRMVEALRERGENFKIIYSLPFVSIIEQNYKVLKDLLLKTQGRADSEVILKHHHLTEIAYKRDGRELPFEYSKLLTESWESSVITTTMVQLFNALFPKNRNSAMRFSRLSKSVIILDEVQTIPLKLWEITRRTLLELSEKLDFYIIFMTATKPMLFEEGHYVELADKKFFKGLNRYQVKVEIDTQKTARELVEEFEPQEGKRYLFIANTIRSSQEIYNLLLEKGFSEDEVEYLSSSIVPYDRRERIKKIGKTKILVSTQVVEAGMDIDFDEVIRDLAPFDALNQSAGRCNRNAQSKGLFRIVHLIDDERDGRPYYSYIYDSILVSATKEILKGRELLTEEEFTYLVEDYFREIKDRGVDPEKIEKLFESVRFLRFDGEEGARIRDIELVKEEYPRDEIFVQLNGRAVEVFNKMKEIVKRLKKGQREALKDFIKLKPIFYDFVARANLKDNVKPLFDDELSIYYVPIEDLESYYGKTGLKEPDLLW